MGSAAPGQMTGYLYQVQVACLHFLKNMASFSSDTLMRLENFDDIDFSDSNGDPKTILQTKHSIKSQKNLTNSSADLWKTIHNWINLCNTNNFWGDKLPAFYLITTGSVKKNDIAWYLTQEASEISERRRVIDKFITERDALTDFQRSYQALQEDQKNQLLKNIYIICNAPQSKDIENSISQFLLKGGLLPESTEVLRQELINWWYGESIGSLSKKDPPFTKKIFESKLREYQHKSTRKLTIYDTYDKNLTENKYLEQLHIISYKEQKEMAQEQFCWAFHHRGEWLKNGEVTDSELEKYNKALFEEWREQAPSIFRSPKDDEKKGKDLYDKCVVDHRGGIPFHECLERNLPKGSYQMLANDLKIGWHPDYKNRLKGV